MNLKTRSTNRAAFGLRLLIGGVCTAAALAFATQASALTSIGPGAFSGTATTLTFEDLPGDGSPLPAGYGSGSGVAMSAGTESELYTNYGATLATAATTAGLGNVGATFGCSGACGTGFSLTSAQTRVGFYLSSNVDITNVQVSAFKSGVLLGSQTLSVSANEIGFAGFEDAGGIDQIVIGDNTGCTGCVHQVDNVVFESAGVAPVAAIAVPTMSQWGTIILSGLLAMGAVITLRRRRQ